MAGSHIAALDHTWKYRACVPPGLNTWETRRQQKMTLTASCTTVHVLPYMTTSKRNANVHGVCRTSLFPGRCLCQRVPHADLGDVPREAVSGDGLCAPHAPEGGVMMGGGGRVWFGERDFMRTSGEKVEGGGGEGGGNARTTEPRKKKGGGGDVITNGGAQHGV